MIIPFPRELSDDDYVGRKELSDIRSSEDSIIPNISLDDFYKLLVAYGWCFETSINTNKDYYFDFADGQCAVTAAFTYDVFGGKIIKPSSWHYANEINGIRLDFTSSVPLDYEITKIKHLPRWMVCRGKDSSARLELLKKRVFDAIEEINKLSPDKTVRFIDLFAGIGGIRKGFELACEERGINTECVFTSEIKPYAIEVLKQNHPDEEIHGDITKIAATDIPDFDFLLGGFPCQAFSSAGKRLGFEDTRGTLFFDIARILKEKQPFGFVLENVEGLINHDRRNKKDGIGRTLTTILQTLDELNYKVSWRVLNAKDFGVPQDRKRIYIVGTKKTAPCLEMFSIERRPLETILEHGKPTSDSAFVQMVLQRYPIEELYGKSIKDKRGGDNNIHSWDIECKGPISDEQKELLNTMLTERRKKKWADDYGVEWMDGMPLTIEQIRTFFDRPNLEEMLSDLTKKGYIKLEHPKKKEGNLRVQDTTLPLGYNIVAGKMSFEINKVLDPKGIAPTLVAMDMQHLFVVDGTGLRALTLREGLRLFGYPDSYKFDVSLENGYDLLGNTVVVPVIKAVSSRVLDIYCED